MNKPKLLNGMSVVVGALFVFLLSRALVIQAASVWTSVPNEPRQATTSDLLSPGYSQTISAGNIVTFTHVLTNVTTLTDSFALTATSSQGWPVELYGPTETLTRPVQLEAGFTTTVLLQVTVPSGVVSGTLDTAIITATSQTSPTLTSKSIDTTVIQSPIWYTYLPLVLRNWPPVPDVPVLNSINNAGANSYTVSWNPADRAITYILQESTEAGFVNPLVRYSGTGMQWGAVNQLTGGTYSYRVKATNAWGESAWSNVQSVYVPSPAPAGIYGRITYLSAPVSGHHVILKLCTQLTTTSWTCPANQSQTTSTQLDGSYQFTTAASLGANQKYGVYFYNYDAPSPNPNYLLFAGGPDILSYSAGQTVSGGVFDVANIPLLEPADGTTSGYPLTFRWTPRPVGPLDSYQLFIWKTGIGSVEFDTPLLGHVGSYTLTSPPANFGPGTYAWNIEFRSSAGYWGTSFETREITIPGESRK